MNSNGTERISWERNSDSSRAGRRTLMGSSWKISSSMDNIDIGGGTTSNRSSLSDDDNHEHFSFRNMIDVAAKDSDFSFVSGPRRDDTQQSVSTKLNVQIHQ